MQYLIVPMKVEAFLQNNIVSEDKRVPLASPDYCNAVVNSFLGSNNTPQPFNLDLEQLPCGMHLHFILPDMFTHAPESGEYPPVPNRYIVTRLHEQADGSRFIKCFIVESNFISDDKAYSGSVTVPMFSDGIDGSMFRYIGRSYPCGNPPAGIADYLSGLTAVGAGDPAFAAYYPSCRTVFGYYDDLKEVPVGSKICYFVAGCFSSPAEDPLGDVRDLEGFQKVLARHALSIADKEKFRCKTAVYGMVGGILWEGPSGNYGKGIPVGEIDVSIGNSSAEALSTVVKEKLSMNGDNSERFFNALQYSLLEDADEMDGNFKIDDGIHSGGFEAVDNQAWSVELSLENGELENIGPAYTALVNKSEALASEEAVLDSERRKLYCLWEQYMYLYEDDDSEKIPSKEAFGEEIKAVADIIKEKEEKIITFRQELESAEQTLSDIMPELALSEKNASGYFYSPKEPVILLSGSGIDRSFAFGEDGRFTDDGTLFCQMDCVTADITQEKILDFLGEIPEPGFLEQESYREFLWQTALLNPEIKSAAEKSFGAITVGGNYSPVLLNNSPQAFTTLYMDWSLRFYPTRTSLAGEDDNTLSGWTFEYGSTNYRYSGERSGERNLVYTGRTVVTPHSVYHLKNVLKRWLEVHSDDEVVKKAVEKIHKLPVISQNLGGLSEQLCGLKYALQFPVTGNANDKEIVALVKRYSADQQISPVPSAELFTMRGGHFRVDRLNLIGTFGQVQHVIVPAGGGSKMQKIYYAETVISNIADYAFLTPGFLTPSRLSFRWISAVDNSCLAAPDMESTPVCGFILPEILNRRLLAYSNNGDYLGSLRSVFRNETAYTRWISAPGLNHDIYKIEVDETLRAFLIAAQKEDMLTGLMRLIDKNFEKTLQSGTISLIWGRPLALVRASIRLLCKGKFDYTKEYKDFKKYNSRGLIQ